MKSRRALGRMFWMCSAGCMAAIGACASESSPGPGGDAGASSDGGTSGGGNTDSGESGQDAAPGDLKSQCESAADALCAKACSCATDGKCHLIVIVDSGSAAVNYESEAKCLETYKTLGCLMPDPSTDFAKCKAEVDAAACIEAGGQRGVQAFDSCRQN